MGSDAAIALKFGPTPVIADGGLFYPKIEGVRG